MPARLLYQYIKDFFESQDCILLSTEYKNNSQKLDFICSCGNQSQINYNKFQYRKKCADCGRKNMIIPHKHTYQFVKEFFQSKNCQLLSTKYENAHQKLDYICSCGNQSSIPFSDFRQGQRCSKCAFKRQKQTMVERYGVENPIQNPVIKEKIKQTNLKKYGFENSLQSPEIKEKVKQTMVERYGVENPLQSPEIREKVKQTNLEKYGVECVLNNSKIKERIKKTNLERYGVENPTQNPDIFLKAQKSAFKRKEVITPSGKTILLQGYEPQAYIKLLEVYSENEILNSVVDMPKLWYIGIDGEKHKYYPDFYIPKDNLIIEVKSTYTYSDEKWYETNLLKRDCCLKNGFKFEFMIIK